MLSKIFARMRFGNCKLKINAGRDLGSNLEDRGRVCSFFHEIKDELHFIGAFKLCDEAV